MSWQKGHNDLIPARIEFLKSRNITAIPFGQETIDMYKQFPQYYRMYGWEYKRLYKSKRSTSFKTTALRPDLKLEIDGKVLRYEEIKRWHSEYYGRGIEAEQLYYNVLKYSNILVHYIFFDVDKNAWIRIMASDLVPLVRTIFWNEAVVRQSGVPDGVKDGMERMFINAKWEQITDAYIWQKKFGWDHSGDWWAWFDPDGLKEIKRKSDIYYNDYKQNVTTTSDGFSYDGIV